MIPTYRVYNEPALLECHYQLNTSKNNKQDYGGYRSSHSSRNHNDDRPPYGRYENDDADKKDEKLYSVKWYKDNEEFYTYVPMANPPQRTHHVDGVKVDVSNEPATGSRETNRADRFRLPLRSFRFDSSSAINREPKRRRGERINSGETRAKCFLCPGASLFCRSESLISAPRKSNRRAYLSNNATDLPLCTSPPPHSAAREPPNASQQIAIPFAVAPLPRFIRSPVAIVENTISTVDNFNSSSTLKYYPLRAFFPSYYYIYPLPSILPGPPLAPTASSADIRECSRFFTRGAEHPIR